MSQSPTHTYEGLFLFPQSASADLKGAVEHLRTVLERASAEVISLSKWDERRLAYEVKGNKRGVYLLVYFTVDPQSITGIERDSNLSEQILRFMIIRAEHLTAEDLQAADSQAQLADEINLRDQEATAPAAESTPEPPATPPAAPVEAGAES